MGSRSKQKFNRTKRVFVTLGVEELSLVKKIASELKSTLSDTIRGFMISGIMTSAKAEKERREAEALIGSSEEAEGGTEGTSS